MKIKKLETLERKLKEAGLDPVRVTRVNVPMKDGATAPAVEMIRCHVDYEGLYPGGEVRSMFSKFEGIAKQLESGGIYRFYNSGTIEVGIGVKSMWA